MTWHGLQFPTIHISIKGFACNNFFAVIKSEKGLLKLWAYGL